MPGAPLTDIETPTTSTSETRRKSSQPTINIKSKNMETEMSSTTPEVNGNITDNKQEATMTATRAKDPTKLIEAIKFTNTKRDGAVKLRLGDTEYEGRTPETIHTMFMQTLRKIPNRVALAEKRDGVWVNWTYQEYYNNARRVARSLIKLGVERYHGVGILGFNAPEWMFSCIGSIFAGAFAVGIYTTNNPEACEYILKDCEANMAIVENDMQLQKILKIRGNLPHLKAIVQYKGQLSKQLPNVYTWEEFIGLSSETPDSVVDEIISSQSPNTCASLIYTSGTTGSPKGVMLSHDNYTWTSYCAIRPIGLEFGTGIFVSYLPLSHVAAQQLDIFMAIRLGFSVFYAQPDALKGSLGKTLLEVRPTTFFGVPRVWEKMMEKMVAAGTQASSLRKSMAKWGRGIGMKAYYNELKGRGKPACFSLANALVFKTVQKRLGLDRCIFYLSAAAPLTKECQSFFTSLNIIIVEAYGMSECTGPHTIDPHLRFGTCGKPYAGASIKIHKPDEDGNGELCLFGRNVQMGYLNQPEKTAEAIDDAGWLHTGDIAREDKDGYLFITGRIKELIITAGGENIAPVPVEDVVREELPIVANCMLVGDRRKFLSMLITLKVEIDMDTLQPLDALTGEAKRWCASVGSHAKTVTDIVEGRDVSVLRAIQAGIDRSNKRAVSRASMVQKWSLLPRDFSVPGGELGPTLKLRRPIVTKLYAKTIDSFYEDIKAT